MEIVEKIIDRYYEHSGAAASRGIAREAADTYDALGDHARADRTRASADTRTPEPVHSWPEARHVHDDVDSY